MVPLAPETPAVSEKFRVFGETTDLDDPLPPLSRAPVRRAFTLCRQPVLRRETSRLPRRPYGHREMPNSGPRLLQFLPRNLRKKRGPASNLMLFDLPLNAVGDLLLDPKTIHLPRCSNHSIPGSSNS